MADVKTAYSSATAITITLTSLANDAARESAQVDNTSNKYRDALVQLKTKTGTGSSTTDTVELYVWGSVDGSMRPDTADGTNSAITPVVPPNAAFLGRVETPEASTAYVSNPFSVCEALGGRTLPPYWGVYVVNRSDSTLSSTTGDHGLSYVGVYDTVS